MMAAVNKGGRSTPAVVFGLFETGLGVIRSLGRMGIPVIGIDCKKDLAWPSRYVQALLCPPPLKKEGLFLSWISRSFIAHSVKLPAFITSDDFLTVISRNRVFFQDYFAFNLADSEIINRIGNKYDQYLMAKSAGIDVPATICLEKLGDLEHLDPDRLNFPLFLKGLDVASWRSQVSTSTKGLLIDSPHQLRVKAEEYLRKGVPLIAQEVIRGQDSDHYKYNCYIGTDGQILAEFCLQKVRQNPIHFGVGSMVISTYEKEVISLGRSLFTKINFRGIGSAEFKRDQRDGVLKLIEINPRYWQQNYLSTACGVNFPYVNYRDLNGEPAMACGDFRRGVRWLSVLSDLKSAWNYKKEGSLTFRQWFRTMKAPRVYASFALDDPFPALFAVWLKLAGIFSRLFSPGESLKKSGEGEHIAVRPSHLQR